MALSNVNIIRSTGGISRPPDSEDGITGLIYYGTHSSAGTAGISYKIFTSLDALQFTPSTSVLYYHVEQYFKKSAYPLYVHCKNISPSTFSEVVTLKDYSNGEIRIAGVLNEKSVYSSTHITALQLVATQCEVEYAPLQIVYSSDITGNVESLTTLTTLTSPRVSFVIAEDQSGEASALSDSGSNFVGAIGTTLGVISSAPVHENIGYVKKYNLVDSEWSIPGFIDGSLESSKAKTFLDTLDSYHYTFVRKFVGSSGVYFNFSYTADSSTSEFNTIENNRVYDKAFRNLRTVLLPETNSPLYVDASGKLAGSTIIFFKNLSNTALQTMKDAGELSDFSVDIDPNQKVLLTNQLNIVAEIIPVGVAKTISVSLGFVLTLK